MHMALMSSQSGLGAKQPGRLGVPWVTGCWWDMDAPAGIVGAVGTTEVDSAFCFYNSNSCHSDAPPKFPTTAYPHTPALYTSRRAQH